MSHRLECVPLTWILKREQDSYQESLYNHGYLDRPDPRNIRKSSVPELNSHLQPANMAHHGSLPPHDYYQQESGLPTRPTEGFYRGEHPHSFNRSSSHYGMYGWSSAIVGTELREVGWFCCLSTGIPPPPPPTLMTWVVLYREPSLPGHHLLLLHPK